MTTALITLVIFCGLVFVHEFGHFAAAKAVGVRVLEFSIGMGMPLLQRTAGDTVYSLRAFPVGGYCKLEGEDEFSEDERSFNRQPVWAKALIISAGSFMNILTTLLILSIVHIYAGTYTTVLDVVTEQYPAYEAGIRAGDRIVTIDGIPQRDWMDIVGSISESEGDFLSITVYRDGSEQTFVSAVTHDDTGKRVIGISPSIEHSVGRGIREAVRTTGDLLSGMGAFLRQLVTGQASSADVVGPVGLVTIIGQQVRYGWINVLFLAALISLNLGVVNLLPIPALDGGRLLFIFIRAVSGGRISDEAEARIHFTGMILLFALMIYLVFKDTLQFIL